MTATATATLNATIDRKALADALALLGRIVKPRSPKESLTCVLIEAAGGEIRLTGCNLEQRLSLTLNQCSIEGEGVALIPAERFRAIVGRLPDTTLVLRVKDSEAEIVAHSDRFSLFTVPPADFPPADPVADAPSVSVDAATLRGGIDQVTACVAKENSRYAINGVYLDGSASKMTITATDGYKLGAVATSVRARGVSAIVPTIAADLIAVLCESVENEVELRVHASRLTLRTDTAELDSILIEGNFPPYMDIIPGDEAVPNVATIGRRALIDKLETASLLTSEESKGVLMSFSASGLRMTSRAPERGEADVTCPLDSYTGKPIEIGVHPFRLIDMLKPLHADRVDLRMGAPNKPIRINAGDYFGVMLPVNLQR